MVAKHPVDTVTCDCIAEPVEEDRFVGRAVAYEGEQRVDGCRPERAPAYLAALASELYVAEVVGNEVEIADPQRRCFGDASAGVVKEQQERMIAPALLGAAIGSGEHCVHLRLVHIGEFVAVNRLNGTARIWLHQAICSGLRSAMNRAIAWTAASLWLRVRMEHLRI